MLASLFYRKIIWVRLFYNIGADHFGKQILLIILIAIHFESLAHWYAKHLNFFGQLFKSPV
jgi:hypothetical protein